MKRIVLILVAYLVVIQASAFAMTKIEALDSLGKKGIPLTQVEFFNNIQKADYQLVSLMLDAGISPDVRDSEGRTALMIAAYYDQRLIAEELLKCGANINAKTNLGGNALFYAVLSGKEDIVDRLITYGIDRTVTNSKGDSAYSLARKNGYLTIAQTLKNMSAPKTSTEIDIPVEYGSIMISNLKFTTYEEYFWRTKVFGNITNNTSVTMEHMNVEISLCDSQGRLISEKPDISTISSIRPGEILPLRYVSFIGVKANEGTVINVRITGGNASGFIEVSPENILPGRENWIGKNVTYVKKRGTDSDSYSNLSHYNTARIDADKLYNRIFEIKGLFREIPNGEYAKYYWKLVDNSNGDVVWYDDDWYRTTVNKSYTSYTKNRPFWFEDEIESVKSQTTQFKSIIGKYIWADLRNSYSLKAAGVGHLERLSIDDVQISDYLSELTLRLKKDDGNIISWNYRFANELLPKRENTFDVLSTAFLLNSPYEEHSDWSRDVWDLIRERRIQIGWNKQMCLLSWGRPSKINQTMSNWGTHEQWVYRDYVYVYFEDGILSTIQN